MGSCRGSFLRLCRLRGGVESFEAKIWHICCSSSQIDWGVFCRLTQLGGGGRSWCQSRSELAKLRNWDRNKTPSGVCGKSPGISDWAPFSSFPRLGGLIFCFPRSLRTFFGVVVCSVIHSFWLYTLALCWGVLFVRLHALIFSSFSFLLDSVNLD